jgi:hypothetical protein
MSSNVIGDNESLPSHNSSGTWIYDFVPNSIDSEVNKKFNFLLLYFKYKRLYKSKKRKNPTWSFNMSK